jgi:hypothetical protein
MLIAIDEMMVKFKGRSKDTIRMRDKPIKESYKVFALSEHGYTWAFLFSSRVMGSVGLRPWANVRDLGFSKTDQTVVQLAGSLPSREFSFNIFFDNLFSNIPLFHALRLLDIGATGTARPNSREYPTEFKFRGRGPIFPHNTISGLVRRDVLAVLWQDKKLVRFLTTIHKLTSPSNYILVDRNPPQVTGASRELVRQGWGNEPFVAQRNPVVAVEYSQDDDVEHAERGFDPSRQWEPFDSEADFMLAQYMVDFGITDGAMDHLLKTVLPSLGVHHAVRSVHAVKKRIDQMQDGLGHQSWRRNTTTLQWNDAHPAPIEFYSRDILRCARWLLQQPAYEDDLVYAPERHFNDAGSRIYGAMHTGDWWWEQQVCPRARRTAHADRGLVCAARGGYGGATHFYVRRDTSHQLCGRQEGLAGLHDHRQPLSLGSQSAYHAERAIGRLAAGADQVAGCRLVLIGLIVTVMPGSQRRMRARKEI